MSQSLAIQSDAATEALLSVAARHWGFKRLRPLQGDAMRAVLAGRDSLLVLPTGGGKSLCYQAPAVVSGRTTVVLSPLISLMKDQVDALRTNGIAAAALDSALSPDEARAVEADVIEGRLRLLYVSPERMATPGFRRLLSQIDIRTIAIDEAHCISHWGHDFRPEYRLLSELRDVFPDASLHAFTATATRQVREDIAAQLRLRDPVVLVGDFDRPNLAYRVVRRVDVFEQTLEVLAQHRAGEPNGDAGIIYCIRRRDVDDMVVFLKSRGIAAMPYHAGLTPPARKKTQDAFSSERCDLVVATVAFGMGIDRLNVRFVLHTGMPKSIEHYQQETGRAGRDGLEADCVLLASGADAMLWRNLLDKSIGESETPVDPQYVRNAKRHIDDMEGFCRPIRCRHRALVEYFGQTYAKTNCQACDVCLGDGVPVTDAQTIARKILSCVARVDQRFGAGYVASVLHGERKANILERGHDQLTTFGLLREFDVRQLRDWIDQLLGQELLVRETDDQGDYPVLKLNEASWEVMRNEREARLFESQGEKRSAGKSARGRSRGETASWEGVDRGLFDALRAVRRDLATERGVPPFVVFSDATLRDMARRRPSSLPLLRDVYGVGETKLAQFGAAIWTALDGYCCEHELTRDQEVDVASATDEGDDAPRTTRGGSLDCRRAADLFRQGKSMEDVILATGRAFSTVSEYLVAYIRDEQPASIEMWVPEEIYREVAAAAEREGYNRLKPIYAALEERVSYNYIRLVLAHLAVTRGDASA